MFGNVPGLTANVSSPGDADWHRACMSACTLVPLLGVAFRVSWCRHRLNEFLAQVGERVRWYVLDLGTDFDMHSAIWCVASAECTI
jgi:hypothetical protein